MNRIFLGIVLGLAAPLAIVASIIFLYSYLSGPAQIKPLATDETGKILSPSDFSTLKINLEIIEPLQKKWAEQSAIQLRIVEDAPGSATSAMTEAITLTRTLTLPGEVEFPISNSFLETVRQKSSSRFLLYIDACIGSDKACQLTLRARSFLPKDFAQKLINRNPSFSASAKFTEQLQKINAAQRTQQCFQKQFSAKVQLEASADLLRIAGPMPDFILAVVNQSSANFSPTPEFFAKNALAVSRLRLVGKTTELTLNYRIDDHEAFIQPFLIKCDPAEQVNTCLGRLTKDTYSGRSRFDATNLVVVPTPAEFLFGKCDLSGTKYYAHSFGAGPAGEEEAPEMRFTSFLNQTASEASGQK